MQIYSKSMGLQKFAALFFPSATYLHKNKGFAKNVAARDKGICSHVAADYATKAAIEECCRREESCGEGKEDAHDAEPAGEA